ncbi:hypothetical protein MMC30_002052 [Trapelia coarctata]|nr:hypothetical protein [Trapelia coarctata]
MDQFKLAAAQRRQIKDIVPLAENAVKAIALQYQMKELKGLGSLFMHFNNTCRVYRHDADEKKAHSDALDTIYGLIVARFKTVLESFEQMHDPEGILHYLGLGRACCTTPDTTT